MISKVFCVFSGFIFTVFQSRFLGPEIKGQVATINSILNITSIVFALGIYQAYPYYKKNSDQDVMPVFLKIGLLMLAVQLTISVTVVITFHLSIKYAAVFLLTPLLVYDGLISYITLVEEPIKRNVTDMLVMVGELLLVIVFWLTAKPSLLLGVIVITVKDITKSVIFSFWWKNRIFVSSDSIWKWIPKLVKFGFFPMLSLLMSTLNYRVDVIMLDGAVSDAQIGIYSVGVMIVERLWMVPDALKGVMVSKLTKGKDAEEVAYVIRICNTLCLLLAMGIILLGKPFIDVIFGKEYSGAYPVILILLFGVFPMIYYRTISSYNIVMGKQFASFVMLSVAVGCNVVANYLLIPGYGIYGAGVASVISYFFCSVLFLGYFIRTSGISIRNMLLVRKNDVQRFKSVLHRRNQ